MSSNDGNRVSIIIISPLYVTATNNIAVPQDIITSSDALIITLYGTLTNGSGRAPSSLFQVAQGQNSTIVDTVVFGFVAAESDIRLPGRVIITLQSFRAQQNQVL